MNINCRERVTQEISAEILDAIERSGSHNEITLIEAADRDAAMAAMAEARKAAESADLVSGWTDCGAYFDVWAAAADAADGDMEWRIKITW